MDKQTTCCFTGHRPHKVPLLGSCADPRYKELENAVALLDPHLYGGTAYTVSLARKNRLNVVVVDVSP